VRVDLTDIADATAVGEPCMTTRSAYDAAHMLPGIDNE